MELAESSLAALVATHLVATSSQIGIERVDCYKLYVSMLRSVSVFRCGDGLSIIGGPLPIWPRVTSAVEHEFASCNHTGGAISIKLPASASSTVNTDLLCSCISFTSSSKDSLALLC